MSKKNEPEILLDSDCFLVWRRNSFLKVLSCTVVKNNEKSSGNMGGFDVNRVGARPTNVR